MEAVSGKGNRSELRPLLSDYYSESGVKSRRLLVSEGSGKSGADLLKKTEVESSLSGEVADVRSRSDDQFVTNTMDDRSASKGVSEGVSKGVSKGVSEEMSEGMTESSALAHHRRVLSDLRETPSCGGAMTLGSCAGRRNCPRLLWVVQR